MRSGSTAHDGGEWPSAQRPYPDEATSGPVQYGPGPRSDPQEDPGGRREAPFGPEVSWPRGFRPLDPQTREVLESAYDTGTVYQQPAVDDYGYGDPGYADPSYDGPRAPRAGSGFGGESGPAGTASSGWSGYRQSETTVPGYQVPGIRDSSRPGYAGAGYPSAGSQRQDFASPPSGGDIYPVTGAQEALPDTGPLPLAPHWPVQDSGSPAETGSSAYPEQWYDHPRLDDRVLDDRVLDDRRLDGPRPADPRLAGMRYDELRYDEPSPDGPGLDQAFNDESWYEELRRSAPAYPQTSGGRPLPDGPAHRSEPQAAGYSPQPGYRAAPAPDRSAGYQPPRGDRGDSGPQLSAGPATRPGPRTGQESAFLSAPTAFSAPAGQVGVLTPPAARPAVPAVPGVPAVRPGHGLDGPEITSSWPVAPQVDELESFAEFWREDAEEAEYAGLFGDREIDPERAGPAAKRRIGRRRGRSNDHRLWLALGGVVVVAAAAITGIIKFEFPSHGGPAHTMVTPATIGTYVRTVDLERQTNVAQLRAEVIKMSAGHASGVESAVYESGNSAAGNDEQIIMFIGGHLANAAPATSVASFTQKFPGAQVVSAGSLGGKAACVEEGGSSDSVSMCAWFDNDSFGEIVSPTMNATALAKEMLTVRPAVETVVKPG